MNFGYLAADLLHFCANAAENAPTVYTSGHAVEALQQLDNIIKCYAEEIDGDPLAEEYTAEELAAIIERYYTLGASSALDVWLENNSDIFDRRRREAEARRVVRYAVRLGEVVEVYKVAGANMWARTSPKMKKRGKGFYTVDGSPFPVKPKNIFSTEAEALAALGKL